jgi:putative hydrolase of the HAD superfamily
MDKRMFAPGVRAAFFDAVGTLIHPDPPAAVVYATVGRRYGSRLLPAAVAGRFATAFERQEALDRRCGLRTNEAREAQRWREIVAEVLDDVADGEKCFRELYEHFARPDAWSCDPDAATTLAELARRGYVLGMASNYDHRLRRVVAGRPELRPLQHLVISSEVGWRKPAAQFYSSLCQAVGLAPEQTLYVGDDRAVDYDGARAAGLQAVLLDRTQQEQPPVRRVTRLSELLREGFLAGPAGPIRPPSPGGGAGE